jgi:hypothetical protein
MKKEVSATELVDLRRRLERLENELKLKNSTIVSLNGTCFILFFKFKTRIIFEKEKWKGE